MEPVLLGKIVVFVRMAEGGFMLGQELPKHMNLPYETINS